MQLWNDYEGRTIADAYPLGKLLRPEGRSAFFSTSNGTGTPSVIRIIEAHFDESEILNRWKMISEMDQPNLVSMRKFGEAELDGTPLVYALMEPTDASLAEVLCERTLTVDETRQLATSLVTALEALHSRDLVHEHIEPENILAAGETVKLRSDCIREASAGLEENSPEIAERKARDVHDLAVVLLQALTGHRALKGSATLLPTPFDGIIRNGLSGTWGLRQMAAALDPSRTAVISPASTPVATPVDTAHLLAPVAPVRANPVFPAAEKPAAAPPAAVVQPPKTEPPLKPAAPPVATEPVAPRRPVPDVRDRIVKPVQTDPRRTRVWMASAVGALLLLLLAWYFMRQSPQATSSQTKQDARPISTLAAPDKPSAAPPLLAAKPPAAVSTPSAAAAPATGGKTRWRVVAYTYNREDQAMQKAATIASRTPDLRPEVFAPSGHSPYLVTLGGPMSREEASAFRRKAVSAGLPEDTYIQNYTR